MKVDLMPIKMQLTRTPSYDFNLNPIKKGLTVKNLDEASKIALLDRMTFFQICVLQKVMQAMDDVRKASAILSLENYILAKIECMSDEKKIQQALYQALDNPDYSAENYRSCRKYHQQHENRLQFLAKFKNGE